MLLTYDLVKVMKLNNSLFYTDIQEAKNQRIDF